MRKLPQIEDFATDQMPSGNALQVDIDRVTASRLGINPQTVDSTLYDAFGQRQITTLYTQTNQYHVILEADPTLQTHPTDLNNIYLQTSSGASSSSGQTSSGAGGGSATQLTPGSTSGVGGVATASSTLASGQTAASQLSTSTLSSALSGTSVNSTVLQSISTSTSSSTTALNSTKSAAGGSGGSSVSAGTSLSGGGGGGSSASTTSRSNPIPLAAFASYRKTLAPLTINHQSQFPVVTISFNLAPGAALSQAVNAVDKTTADLNLPLGMQARWQGTAASFRNSLANEGLLVIAALVTVYIVLGVLYESFIHPLTILSTLPSAGVGALVALTLFHQDLGILGIVLLIGIVKKNGIMMVDFALVAERTEGKSAEEAIYQASLLRFRPILMTTMAALLAGLPLALGTGIGAELRRPLGISMVGGLLLSQLLTLYTTPVIYIWFDRLSQRFRERSAVAQSMQLPLPEQL